MIDYEINDEFSAEDLSEEEKEELFNEQFITDKDELLRNLESRKEEFREKAKTDKIHSSAFHHTLLSLVDQFKKRVKDTLLFNKLEPYWAYSYEIRSDGITLFLTHYSSVEYDEDNNTTVFVDQEFELVKVPCRMLTIDEYAKMYGVENVTVRQWIGRGKIRNAAKYGKEWRIPELTDFPRRGYKFGQYSISKEAVFPEPYSYLSLFTLATIYQDEKNRSLFHIDLGSKDTKETKKIVCSAKKRKEIEVLLIENPFVKYLSDSYYQYS